MCEADRSHRGGRCIVEPPSVCGHPTREKLATSLATVTAIRASKERRRRLSLAAAHQVGGEATKREGACSSGGISVRLAHAQPSVASWAMPLGPSCVGHR